MSTKDLKCKSSFIWIIAVITVMFAKENAGHANNEIMITIGWNNSLNNQNNEL